MAPCIIETFRVTGHVRPAIDYDRIVPGALAHDYRDTSGLVLENSDSFRVDALALHVLDVIPAF